MPDIKTVLLVEDNDDSRALFRHILEDRGFNVLDYAHAECLPNPPPHYHLALLDQQLGLGRETGLHLASRLKQHAPHTPIVLMSADVISTAHPQVNDIVQKAGISTLMSVIQQWL